MDEGRIRRTRIPIFSNDFECMRRGRINNLSKSYRDVHLKKKKKHTKCTL